MRTQIGSINSLVIFVLGAITGIIFTYSVAIASAFSPAAMEIVLPLVGTGFTCGVFATALTVFMTVKCGHIEKSGRCNNEL